MNQMAEKVPGFTGRLQNLN